MERNRKGRELAHPLVYAPKATTQGGWNKAEARSQKLFVFPMWVARTQGLEPPRCALAGRRIDSEIERGLNPSARRWDAWKSVLTAMPPSCPCFQAPEFVAR